MTIVGSIGPTDILLLFADNNVWGRIHRVFFCLNIHIPVCKTAYQRILITKGKKNINILTQYVYCKRKANAGKQKLSRKKLLGMFSR
jgi:hypothetical protein